MRAWEFRRAAAAFIMPNRCPFCDELIGVREFWCEKCYQLLRFTDDPGEIPDGLDSLTAVCSYSGRARSAVLRMKNGFCRYPADAFAVLIAENAVEQIRSADIITAIPTGKRRKKQLGYAQSELIARMLAEMTGKPFRRLLEAAPDKIEQKRLTRPERFENAMRSYSYSGKEDITGRNVLVIDDVCTTGATLSVAAELLRNAGAAHVSGAVFARTPDRRQG